MSEERDDISLEEQLEEMEEDLRHTRESSKPKVYAKAKAYDDVNMVFVSSDGLPRPNAAYKPPKRRIRLLLLKGV